MEKIKNNLFDIPLHKAGSRNDLRIQMTKIHFVSGFAYATNGYIAVRIKIEPFYLDKMSTLLSNKSIPLDIFQEIYVKNKRCKSPISCTDRHITGIDKGVSWRYEPEKMDDSYIRMTKQVDKFIKEASSKKKPKSKWNSKLGMNAKLLSICQEILGFDDHVPSLTYYFGSEKDNVLLTYKNYPVSERTALIAPTLIT